MTAAKQNYLDIAVIAAATTGLSILYGVLHDLVTAHVCVQYFTVYHPKLIDSNSPVAMAFLWGVIATWWFGLGGGIALGSCAVLGSRPQIPVVRVLKLILILLVIIFALAMICLLLARQFGRYIPPTLVLPSDAGTNLDYQSRLIAVGLTHNFSYAANFFACIGLCFWIWQERHRLGFEMSKHSEMDRR